ncbi:hypothetical protein [Deinococcus ficus]|uniref:Uncharacterized protein n=1 Tax=Deinococcus ficus TaxID=317577 RepID=A0A221T3C3_9DEIO|nr:hypothetical protein [Deinococcus ficus]ASN83404.1 hypothetical protein DFI_19595 [Deinococcus ficus]
MNTTPDTTARPTLTALADTHFGGDVTALVRLLDTLTTDVLRAARIERHQERSRGGQAQS